MTKALLALSAAALLAACGDDISTLEDKAPAQQPPPAAAAPAAPAASAATYARRQIGEAQVTTVLDGRTQFDAATLFQGITPQESAQLLQAGGEGADGGAKWNATVQGFVVDVGGRRVLVDSGAGGAFPGTGQLAANLALAGVTPESVSAVAITHLHGDHVGGVIDAQGRARFPNATLHVHADEAAFWTDAKREAAAPAEMKDMFQLARRAIAAYGDRVRTFRDRAEIVPGFTAEPATGHTPGHTVYRLSSGGQQVLFIGDLMHARSIQMPRPNVTLAFDADQAAARAARQGVLQQASSGENVLLAGPHFPFPGIGRVERAGQGYRFVAPEAAAAAAGAPPAGQPAAGAARQGQATPAAAASRSPASPTTAPGTRP